MIDMLNKPNGSSFHYMPNLSLQDVSLVKTLLMDTADQFDDTQSIDFIKAAPLIAHELPYALRRFLLDFKIHEKPICVIPSLDIIGYIKADTPSDWSHVGSSSLTHLAEIYLVLVSALLGDIFGWKTQQDGRYVHDILPMKKHESDQVGFSSRAELSWHTEDAFHRHRADYLSLLCLCNPQAVATTFFSVKGLDLSSSFIETLFQKRFLIKPDLSHTEEYNSSGDSSFEKITNMNLNPEKVSVLFGDEENPYLRIDPDYMEAVLGDRGAAEALQEVINVIDRGLEEIVLSKGDLLIIDNYRAVHGRRPFQATYAGNDRWLKRVNVKRDLRQSFGSIISGTHRVI